MAQKTHELRKDLEDSAHLQVLGVETGLKRSWGLLQNFGSSFAVISIPTGMTSLFLYGLNTGGPATMVIGWICGSFMTLFVAFAMAEIVSYVPSAGGPYHWAFLVAPRKHRAFYAWLTGWFNLAGQIAVTTGITYGEAIFITTIAAYNQGWAPTAAQIIGVYAALLVSHAIINSIGIVLLKYLNNVSIICHSLGIFSLSVAVLSKASPNFQPASFVYGDFVDNTGWALRASPAYVCIIGLLYTQFTITGYDASAHMSEETHNAARNAPIGVILSVSLSALFGFFYLNSLLFSVQDVDDLYADASGNPVYQIFLQLFSQTGATILFSLIMTCVYFCGLFSLAANSRMMYAFARDGALPKQLTWIWGKNNAPIATIWLSGLLAFCLALPSLGSTVAYSAATSIATIGLYLSYGIPIGLGIFTKWPRGPFSLGIASKPVAAIAVGYVGFITVAFCLPEVTPVTSTTLNYAPICVGTVAAWAILSWVFWARKWFVGPVEADVLRQHDQQELQIERAEKELNIEPTEISTDEKDEKA